MLQVKNPLEAKTIIDSMSKLAVQTLVVVVDDDGGDGQFFTDRNTVFCTATFDIGCTIFLASRVFLTCST